MKESPLSPLHRKLGAVMHNDNGWHMPQHYTDLVSEHLATHSACGMFDISPLGKFRLTGNGAMQCLEQLLSNNVTECCDGHTQQTLLLRPDGMILDRITLCRQSAGRFFMVGSASQAEADFDMLQRAVRHASLTPENLTDSLCGIALVGPDAEKVLARGQQIAELPRTGTFSTFRRGGHRCILMRAGLLSKGSMELFCPAAVGIAWFEQLLAAGATPCGTRTRDYLRVARGRADVACEGTPFSPQEAGLESLCSSQKDYIGAESLHHTPASGRRLVALHSTQPGSAWLPGDSIHNCDGRAIGSITSTEVSPVNGHSVALAYISTEHAAPGTHLQVQTDDGYTPAQVGDKY